MKIATRKERVFWLWGKRSVWLISLLLWAFVSVAQTTKIRGKVTDAATGEPLPLVSITVPGTTIGTTTDFEGIYALEIRESVTEIAAIFLLYETQTATVQPGVFNTVNFALKQIVTDMEAVVVMPGENPAHAILRNVSRHKKYNNPDEKESYRYSTYTKMELDITQVKPQFRNRKMQRDFGFVFEHMDTSALTGKSYLPVMITESSADYYYRRSPKLTREILKASRISGVEDYNFAQFTGKLYVNVNLYENYINIFDVNFASPLSDHGLMFYHYFLVDSVRMGDRQIYKIRFHPKSKADPVFDGEINIDRQSWALESATLRMARGVNVNWIHDLVIENRNQLLNDSTWFPKQDKLMVDFTLDMRDSSRFASFMAHRQIDYSDIVLNEEIPPEIAKYHNNVVMGRNVLNPQEEYWASVRPYALSEKERGIYEMVDAVKEAPLYRNIYDLLNTVIVGYYSLGPVELGPYYKLFSFNELEGNRFQLGARTTKELSERFRLSGYGAYSTKDREWKGGGTLEVMFRSLPTSKLTLAAKHDVLQLGTTGNDLLTGNILSSVFSRGNNNKLIRADQFGAQFEQEWNERFTNTIGVEHLRMEPTRFVPFIRPDGTVMPQLRSTSVKVGARFSKDEIIHRKPFDKVLMGSYFPIIGLEFTAGLKGLLNSDYEYYRAELSVRYNFNIAPIGRSYLQAKAGTIFGKVPYPLLKLHEGNDTYFYIPETFSCMNYYEFASDRWASVMWEHHFRGFFLGKIPLMKRLQWREVAIVKALWGGLSPKNNGSLPHTQADLLFPAGMSSVSKPYIELGVGIENIFRIFRVDALWRMTHREHRSRSDNFALNFSFHFDF